MELPDELKIMGHQYAVKCDARLSLASDHLGECASNVHEIRIGVGEGHPESAVAETLLHEIIHALDYHLSLGLEHETLGRLSEGLFQVLSANRLKFFESSGCGGDCKCGGGGEAKSIQDVLAENGRRILQELEGRTKTGTTGDSIGNMPPKEV
jgi:hypothetical protein